MKIIFDISLIFSTSQLIVSQIKAPGDSHKATKSPNSESCPKNGK